MSESKTPVNAFPAWQRETMPAYFAGPKAEIAIGVPLSLMNHIGLEADTNACRLNLLTRVDLPADALALFGSDRQISRGTSETDDQYRTRLLAAWNAWEFAGTSGAIISQLALIGVTATIVENGDWNWDGNSQAWSRFWVLVENSPWTGSTWNYSDGTVWGSGKTWGTSASSQEVDTVLKVCRQWKPAHGYLHSVIVVHDPITWASEQPDGTWGNSANWSQAAAYWRL